MVGLALFFSHSDPVGPESLHGLFHARCHPKTHLHGAKLATWTRVAEFGGDLTNEMRVILTPPVQLCLFLLQTASIMSRRQQATFRALLALVALPLAALAFMGKCQEPAMTR